MSYTPPAHGAVNFDFTGSYTAPAHGAVNFAFTPGGVTLALTGVGSTTVVGTPGVSGSVAQPGVSSTLAVGSVSVGYTAALTGLAATGAVGNTAYSDTISGQADALGTSAGGYAGTLGASLTFALTGMAATGAVGSASTAQDFTAALSGNASIATVDLLDVVTALAPSGNEVDGSAGNVGPVAVEVAITGTVAVGTAGITARLQEQAVTGVDTGSAVGTLGDNFTGKKRPTHGVVSTVSMKLSGNAATGAVGSAVSTRSATIQLDSVVATGDVGMPAAAAALVLTGNVLTGSVAEVIAGPVLSGVSAAGAAGNVSKAQQTGLTGVSALGIGDNLGLSNPPLLDVLGNVSAGAVGQLAIAGEAALTGDEAVGVAGTPVAFVELLLMGLQGAGETGAAGSVLSPDLTGVDATGDVGGFALQRVLALVGAISAGFAGAVFSTHPDTGEGHIFVITYRVSYTATMLSVERTIMQETDAYQAITADAEDVFAVT